MSTVPADKRLRAPEGLLQGVPLMPVASEDADIMEDALLPDPGRLLGPMESEGQAYGPMRPEWPMEGLRAFQMLVDTITYKPGYRLRVVEDLTMPTMGAVFSLDFQQPDTYHPGQMIRLSQNFHLPIWLLELWGELAEARPEQGQDRMLRWVRKALGWHELHERDEWLRVDGVMRFNPHEGDPTGRRFRLRP